MFLGYFINELWVFIFGIIIFYTAINKFCFFYYILKINEKFGFSNYYKTLLPKFNPSPTFIFNYKGELKFKNKAAYTLLPEITEIQEFGCEDHTLLFDIDDMNIEYTHEDKVYQVNIRAINEEKLIVVYATDITELMQLQDDIENTQKEVVYAMGEIAETRSKETGNHVKRVAKYSTLLASLYGLDEKEVEILKIASPMHDIGKVAIADNILNKPGKLTDEEFVIMKTHAQLGYEMLKASDKQILKAAAIVANTHHEKYDGSGYPNKIKGENIHIYGRITAIADVFDALGSKRVYKDAWELDRILELFKEQRGIHFDPKLIDLFFNNLDDFLKIRDNYED